MFKAIGIFFWELIKVFLISMAIIIPIRYFLVQPFFVRGASMEPNFLDGQYLVVDQLSYRLRAPERGEVIVFRYPLRPSQFFIKRIIGLPGETVTIQDGSVIIKNGEHPNGAVLDESKYLDPSVRTGGQLTLALKTSSPRSSAQKRIIWELGRRYSAGGGRSGGSARVTPRSLPPTTPPKRGAVRPRRRKGSWVRRTLLIFVAVITLGAGVFGYKILAASNRISTADRSLLGQLRDLLFRSGEKLQGEDDGRINILLLAVGGEGHSGENLADTIMVASIRPHTDKPSEVALLSIPRDLYVQVPGEQYFSKINAVHAYGEAKGKDQGPDVLRTKVEEITGLPIHYFVRVDFTAFKHIVDAVGGVTITIDNSFFDYWHKIDFQAGTEKMNGERALAYVRARYIEGPEGGDFRRAARQQQVLLALQDKVFSVQTAFDFGAVNSILNSLSDNIRTDMHLWEMKRFYELARSIDRTQVHSTVLTTGPNGVLEGGTEILGGTPASILRPRTGDYSEIQQIAQNIFDAKTLKESPPEGEPIPTPAPDEATGLATGLPTTPSPVAAVKPTLEIRNGTNTTGLAARFQTKLEKEGYTVTAIGNAKNRSTSKTTIYSLDGKYTDAATALAQDLHAQADSGLPSDETATEANALIILGADAEKILGQ